MSSKTLPYAAEAEQEITYLEAKYTAEKEDGSASVDTQFLYAWGLIRSKYQDDKTLGITLLRGHYRLGQYQEARKSISELLNDEPKNQQALSLEKLIENKASQGGVAAAAAGILFAVLRNRARE
ncbi:Mitochondrial fission 1 protein-like protein [Paramicrosporidium saccamoebae]|uniref:Mitochondrial fission 1 protein n=1 Tax=Paramicrosporidium saccamoebae TaxID=1246581 RepID=A0A2H9TM83_9FUNG|nr:Mitochondrial fission 1 protein-like protein [Paramicrosporidium saccamoebae]